MAGHPTRSVLDLVAATRAGGCYDRLRRCIVDRREQHKSSYALRNVIVFRFIAERARHAAAAGRDRPHVVTRRERQHLHRGAGVSHRFLLAVSMEKDFPLVCRELIRTDPARRHFLHEEFIEHQGLTRQLLGIRQSFV